MYDLEGVLSPSVIEFVEIHVDSLLAWDILVYFHRNPEAAMDVASLASRLGRRAEEIDPEIMTMCKGRILECEGGTIRYAPTPELRAQVTEFVQACQDRDQRLALIALVLQRIGRPFGDA